MGTMQGSWPQGAEDADRMPTSREYHTPLTFDRRPCSESDLTFDECRPLFEDSGIPLDDETMWNLGLRTTEGAYTNAALLLSDQCPSITRCIRFEDNTKNTIISKTTIRGSLLRQIREAETFLTQDGALTHAVVREAVTNALVHRDYDRSGPTIINRFASRAEIISLGGLVTGLGNDDLLNGVCQPRNPVLADIISRLGWSENCGTGIQRIMDAYAEEPVCPQLRIGPGSVAIVLPAPMDPLRSTLSGDDDDDASQTTAKRYTFPAIPFADGANAPLDAAGPSIVRLGAAMPPRALPAASMEAMTLQLLEATGMPLSRIEIETTLQLDKNRSTRVLRNLERQGKVVRQGRSRATRYRLA